ncbi:MAG: hypothetical protein Q9227_004478 [Pyrenula ochraceoflavens]
MPSKPRVIYWFRTDLRLHDSPALKAALDLNGEAFYPIWTWDPHYVYRARVGPNRWQFLLDCQSDLSSSLTKLNSKQKLHVVREAPQTVFPKLFKAWKISHLVFEKDTDAYAKDRDQQVMEMAKKAGVEVIVKTGRTLYDMDALVKANGGKPTMSITQVQKAQEELSDPDKPIPAPKSIPDPGDTDLTSIDHKIPEDTPDFNAPQRTSGPNKTYDSIVGPKKDFAVPTLSELGIDKATTPHRGGETRALESLSKTCSDTTYTATFSKPASSPADFSPQSTTLLSPHLHFGSLSVREFWHRVQDAVDSYKKTNKKGSSPTTIPTNLHGQLLFREMYFAAQHALGYSFAQAAGNKVCRFIDWHLPSTLSSTPAPDKSTPQLVTGTYTVDSPTAESYFRRWRAGRTGFPWIDALMRQLRAEGWIHHLGRHAVACFLTRGGCYVHWERGAEVFEEWLLDHETACNTGNWMWMSTTAFASTFYRCYSPVAFGRKWDAEGEFVRRYVPELKDYDKKYLYEPWRAPVADQKKWGCIVKGDGEGDGEEGKEEEEGGMKVYPKPMLDFNERKEVCIQGVKNAYHVGMYGNDKRVFNGEWKKVFEATDEDGAGAIKETTGEDVKETGLNDAGGGGSGTKRARGKQEESGDNDHNNDDDNGGEMDGEEEAAAQGTPKKKGRGRPKGTSSTKGQEQGTLDGHLGRKKARK